MTLTLRSEKGSALTYGEMDDNFNYVLQNFENSGFKITANSTYISFYSNNAIIARIDVGGNLAIKGDVIVDANTSGW